MEFRFSPRNSNLPDQQHVYRQFWSAIGHYRLFRLRFYRFLEGIFLPLDQMGPLLYLCWEQAKLQGNTVTLEKLTENEAVVLFEDSQYFSLYMITSHLKNQISLEDYIKIFETIWRARAKAAGWTLTIDGQGRKIYFRFSR